MKKLIMVCALILLTAPVFAADSYGSLGNPAVKGNFVVSLPVFRMAIGMGDLYKDGRYFFMGANGYESEIQYFIIDKLAIGGIFGYANDKTGSRTVKTTFFGPMANYFFDFKLGPTIPYAGGGLLYKSISNGGAVKDIQLQAHGGVVYMLGKNLSAYGEMQINYDKVSNGKSLSGQLIGIVGGIKAFF